jgi:hypothetical protein
MKEVHINALDDCFNEEQELFSESEVELTSSQFDSVVVSYSFYVIKFQAFNKMEFKNDNTLHTGSRHFAKYIICGKAIAEGVFNSDMHLHKHKTSGDGYR